MKPMVSILIPAYNAEKWIFETLRSAVAQTWPNKEIIVVNDGSKDGTLQVVQQFNTDGVKVLTQENHGAAAARNQAYRLSKGSYIQWLDADDVLSTDKIARQMEVAETIQDRYTLLSSEWGTFLHRFYRAKFVPTQLWTDLSPAEWLFRKMSQKIYMQTSTWLVSRELTEAAGGWNTELGIDDDGEYFCRVLMASNGVRFVPGAKVYYRAVGPASLSYLGESNRKRDELWHSMKLHTKYLRSLEDTPRTRCACVTYLQNLLPDFYPRRPDIVEEMQVLASDLDGQLETPRMKARHYWVVVLFGKHFGDQIWSLLNQWKWSVLRLLDKCLYNFRPGS
jgi:glycosyltransferase involved in cell wall biosynthesis